jgi:hypothetical protein
VLSATAVASVAVQLADLVRLGAGDERLVITLGQYGVAILPVSASMFVKASPSGTSNGTLARPASAAS